MLKDFRTYQLAVTFYRNVINQPIPAHLRDQLRRAASSIVLNLAEGSAKRSAADRRRFYEIALASFREVEAILAISDVTSMDKAASQLGAHLFCLRKSLT